MWGVQPDPKHVHFEAELVGNHQYFASAIEQGARAGEKYRNCEGATQVQAQEILSDLFLNASPVVIQIQRDMVNEKRALRDTDAGRIVNEWVKKAKGGVREFIRELEHDLTTVPGGKGERKKRVEDQYEDAKSRCTQIEKPGGVLQFTFETIREHPYLSALVAAVKAAAAAVVDVALNVNAPVGLVGLVVAAVGGLAKMKSSKQDKEADVPV